MTAQFKRAFRVTVGGTTFDSTPVRPLTFKFQVEKDLVKVPNNANVQIFNLNRDTRAALSAQAQVPVKIDVGYEDGLTQVFLGDLRRANSTKVGPDWVTSLDGGDGEKKITQLRVSRTFRKGTSNVTVLKALAKAVGLENGNIETVTEASFGNRRSDLAANWTAAGNAGDELEFFARSIGLRWSAQDGKMQIAPEGVPAFEGGPLITAETGLIGSPTLDSKGQVELTALLLPDLLPGRAFELDSELISGKFVATHTMHSGDSTGGDWFVKVKGSPLK